MPKVYGTLNLDHGGVTNFKFDPQSDFPDNPTPGKTILKDGRLLVCSAFDNGLPLWVPLTQQISMKTFSQPTPASRWVFTHGMNISTPVVQAWDADGEIMMPSRVVVVDPNTLEVYFPGPIAGALTVMAGVDTGIPAQDIAFDTEIDEAAETWVVTHNLGYNPDVTVLIDGYIVQPASVSQDSTAQVTITFNEPRTGKVILV